MNLAQFGDLDTKTPDGPTPADATRRVSPCPGPAFPYIVGDSARMQSVYAVMKKVAQGDANVCIEGENGTGKELIAQALHASGSRRDRPFVTLDCAAIRACPRGVHRCRLDASRRLRAGAHRNTVPRRDR